jgi:hypothetical protein
MRTLHVAFAVGLLATLSYAKCADAFDEQVRVGNIVVPARVGIRCCTAVSTDTIAGGLSAIIDLKRVTVFTPPQAAGAACADPSTATRSNYLATVVPNKTYPPDYTTAQYSWPHILSSRDIRFFINANFVFIPDPVNKSPYTTDCLEAIGYSFYSAIITSVYNKIRNADTSTLIFYNGKSNGYYADIKNYFPTTRDNSENTGTMLPFYGFNTGQIYNAVSGFWFLKDGQYVDQPGVTSDVPRPRTAVGLSGDDNSTLTILVVNPGDDDKGATLQAVANYFTTLKINNAINLDGSGASQLYFPENNQKSSPSDLLVGGTSRYYRPVPIFLGFQ